jgi:hypothetical protein
MRHQNSVFHSLLKHVPWYKFEQITEEHGADELSRKLTTKRQFIGLLYGQFSGAASLREVVSGMASHETRLYHVGAAPVKRSTLSDANAKRPWQVFGDLFTAMLPQAHRGLRRTIEDAVRLIDSTSVRLSSLSGDWARFSADVFGAKAHIVYDPHADRPVYFAVTAANVNDITAAKAMPIEPGASYVFDLGYYDYGWWAALDDAGCRFVTRLKKNTPFAVVQENRVRKDGDILSDRIGLLPARLANSRKNPMHVPVREIVVRSDSGKLLRIVSNDLDAPAPLQATLGHRVVFPVGQADAADQALHRHLRKRRAHSDRRRPDRLSHPAHGAGSAEYRAQPARIHAARPHKPDAKTANQPAARTASADTDKL